MASPLSEYFIGVGIKRLSQVEVKPELSNQHEFNGIGDFKRIFGTEKVKFATKFIYLSDKEEEIFQSEGNITWYDARSSHPTRSEYRLYYSSNEVLTKASVKDLVVIAKIDVTSAVVIVAPKYSTSEKQLLWLFGFEEGSDIFQVRDLTSEKSDIGFAGRYILTSVGIEPKEIATDFLQELLNRFGKQFPSTKEFSEYSRSTVKDVSPIEAPDETLLKWLDREELLFKTLEKVIVEEVLKKGFGKSGIDVEEFIKFSLSIQNRRKSRAGFSFEHNLAILFTSNNITFSKGAVTERNNKPDFIFPSIEKYHNKLFDISLLSMLGVKTSSKDRWRQVLSEADKISIKHLITLEPAISKNQTEEMKAQNLRLVIPKGILPTYSIDQQKELLTVKDFITIVSEKQART